MKCVVLEMFGFSRNKQKFYKLCFLDEKVSSDSTRGRVCFNVLGGCAGLLQFSGYLRPFDFSLTAVTQHCIKSIEFEGNEKWS